MRIPRQDTPNQQHIRDVVQIIAAHPRSRSHSAAQFGRIAAENPFRVLVLFSANVSLAAAHGSVQPTDGTPLSQVLVCCRRPQQDKGRSTMDTLKVHANISWYVLSLSTLAACGGGGSGGTAIRLLP